MISMLMTDEDGFDFLDVQFQSLHPFFRFPAAEACIYQHSFLTVANVIAIGIAAAAE
jgi:hypothetical protein